MRPSLALLFLLVAAAALAQQPEVPVGLCALAQVPPNVDGKLDDACWQAAEELGPFTLLDGTAPAKEQTSVRTCSDGQALFVGCELLESSMEALRAEKTADDVSDVFANDCVEIFIQPDPETGEYFHLVGSAGGARYDAIASGGPIDWSPKWQLAVGRGPDRWCLEAAIPLAEVRLAGVQEGQSIRFNVCREETPHKELSCWSLTGGTFHNASRFGELVFFSYAPLVAASLERLDDKADKARGAAEGSAAFDKALQAMAQARVVAAREPFGSRDWQKLRPMIAALDKEFDRLARAGQEALVWRVEPWRLPAQEALPEPGTIDTQHISVRLAQNGHASLALAVCNLTERSLAYHVSATDLLQWHDGLQFPSTGRIALREAVSMRTRSGGTVRDALPGLDGAQRLVVPSGENAVLWVTVHARDLPAGSYNAGIDLLPLTGKQRRSVRLNLQVCPVQLPRGGPPFLNNWAVLSGAQKRGWAEAASRDLLEHGVNVNLIQHSDLPWPQVDAAGNLTRELDFAKFDARVRLLPEGSFYLLYLVLNWFQDLKAGLEPGTVEYQNTVTQWTGKIRDHLKELGIGYDRWAFYPIDEPATDEYAQRVRTFADAAHQADPQVLIFANPYNRTTSEQIRLMGDAIDIWCPNLSGLRPEDLQYMKQNGKQVWSYLVLSRLSNPYGSYRLPQWRVFDDGLTGFGFWAYDSVDGDVWDDADGRVSDYAVYYEGTDGPISSVRWEATREGAEDYKYLLLLRQAIARAGEAGKTEAAKTAQGALDAAVQATLAQAGDSGTADRQRRAVLDALLDVSAATGEIDPAALASFSRPVPRCLTGNGGPRADNVHTGGYYTYSTFPNHPWREQSDVTEGKVWFDAADATEGKQRENQIGGDLTDGGWSYQQQYVNLWIWSPSRVDVTFDLMRPYRIRRVDVFAGSQDNDKNRVHSLEVSVSESGEEGSFTSLGTIGDCPTATLGPEGEFRIDVQGVGRYVRLTATKKADSMTLGEVRVWGDEEG